jgi:hypothetical protein
MIRFDITSVVSMSSINEEVQSFHFYIDVYLPLGKFTGGHLDQLEADQGEPWVQGSILDASSLANTTKSTVSGCCVTPSYQDCNTIRFLHGAQRPGNSNREKTQSGTNLIDLLAGHLLANRRQPYSPQKP